MAPLVDVARLTYSYPEAVAPALDQVDLALRDGICLVTGPSGGGKSTLLRLFNGLVPHMFGGRIRGRAVVDGRDVLRTPTRRLASSVGFVFQDAERQAVHATVERDIAFGLENLGTPVPVMRQRVGEIMERLGIAHLRSRTIATLSGGERQRVAVAGALVLRPRLLVLDEPLSQLDGPGARALIELLVELRDAGTTLAVAEHRLDELLAIADSLVAISAGALTGPALPTALAAGLDSAPQVVRLSRLMGWSPVVVDPRALPPLPAGQRRTPTPRTTVNRPLGWRVAGVTAGPGGLLREVTAAGHAGEVVAVMGRNGTGKTTLLRVVAGLLSPRSGSVWRTPGRVAYLPQNPGALLHRESVAAEIAWTVRTASANPRGGDELSAELLHALRVDAIADQDPRDLSSGQRQRAAIAAVLCGEPAIALLDEPTRGMDGPAREGLVTAIHLLTSRGASVVVATHDSDLAASIADRVLVVADGEIRDMGAAAAALTGPDNEFATQLGRLFASPGPATVDAVVTVLDRHVLPAAISQ